MNELEVQKIEQISSDFTVDSKTGEAFISQSITSKLCGVSQAAISKYIAKHGYSLILNDINQLDSNSLESVIGYYAFDSQKQSDVAIKNYRILAKVGVKAYIYDQAGYKFSVEPKQPQIPQNYIESLKALVIAEEEKEVLKIKVESQELELKIAQPKIEVHDRIVSTVSLTDLLQTSKLLGIGRNKFMKFLRNQNILMSQPWNKNIPYQKYCDLGYFEVKTTTWQDFEGNEHINNKCMVTGKGLTWLTKILKNK